MLPKYGMLFLVKINRDVNYLVLLSYLNGVVGIPGEISHVLYKVVRQLKYHGANRSGSGRSIQGDALQSVGWLHSQL